MSRKHVRCISYSPISVYREAQTPWDDVWVRWRDRPGRVRKYGPTLISRADVLGEVEKYEFLISHYAERGQTEMEQFSREELPKARALLARLDAEGYIIDDERPSEGTPNLYTSAEWLTRTTAEDLLAVWLFDAHGIRHPKFEWDHPEFFIHAC